MSKCLVTGGAGFIGSHLVDKLIELDHEVIVIDNESSESHDNFYFNDKAVYLKYSVENYNATKDLYNGIDYVFHMAAETRISRSIDNPVETFFTNDVGTATVLQCAREAGVKKVMYSSTSAAYGLKNSIPNNENQIDDGLNPYSVSKINGEKICKMYTDLYNLPTIIFRYFNAYGERQPTKGQYAPVIGVFFRQLDNNDALTIVGDGEQRRDYVHVSDIVNANILAMEKDIDEKYYGTIFNVGTGINYSVNEIADMISENQVNLPPRVGEAKETLCNYDKIKFVFGWIPLENVKNWIYNQKIGKQ
jgi:UDP-glucose 4-epimerase